MQHSGASSYSSKLVRTSPRLIEQRTSRSTALACGPLAACGLLQVLDAVLKASMTSLNLALSGRLAFKTWLCQMKLRVPCIRGHAKAEI